MKALLDYLSGLTVSQGRLAGQPFRVLPWQQRFVRGAFAPGVQSAAVSIARGNGKTALLSGIACAHLDGPLAVERGEVVLVASSFEQARIAFEHVLAFLGAKLEDKKRWRVWDTAQQARVECNRDRGAPRGAAPPHTTGHTGPYHGGSTGLSVDGDILSVGAGLSRVDFAHGWFDPL